MKKCPYCAEEVQDEAIKCKHCGEFLPSDARGPHAGSGVPPKRLTRSIRDRQICGVCGGFAEHLSMDPTLMRILFVLVTLGTGILPGIIAYIIFAMIIPEA